MISQKTLLTALAAIVLIAGLLLGSFTFGFRLGEEHPKTLIIKNVSNIEEGKPPPVDFSVFWQAWELIDETYLKADGVGAPERVYGAIKGLLGSLNDPYSDFFNPEDNKKFQEDIRGNFSGIGAEIGLRDDALVIVAPLKGTPAMRAGLKGGDKILKINDMSTEGIKVDRAVVLIRGPKDTTVALLILREGWEKPQEFQITRDEIVIPTLEWETKEGNIAHLKLYSFNFNAPYFFARAAVEIRNSEAKGILLDLRGNPGGYLESAVEIAGWFLPVNTFVVGEEGRVGTARKEFKTDGPGLLKEIPLVVLMNEASASASEILAGALRDHRKVALIGEKTFGKGTVQELKMLKDNSSLKLTVAHWVLPSGKILEGEGLIPDHEIKISEEDTKNNRDPQYEKALEVLQGEIGNVRQ